MRRCSRWFKFIIVACAFCCRVVRCVNSDLCLLFSDLYWVLSLLIICFLWLVSFWVCFEFKKSTRWRRASCKRNSSSSICKYFMLLSMFCLCFLFFFVLIFRVFFVCVVFNVCLYCVFIFNLVCLILYSFFLVLATRATCSRLCFFSLSFNDLIRVFSFLFFLFDCMFFNCDVLCLRCCSCNDVV